MENIIDDIREIDPVLQQVRRAARQYRLPSAAPIVQQILLSGDSFYGYRFTAQDFTAVWSAADQVLEVFGTDGRILEVCSLSEPVVTAAERPSVGIETMPIETPIGTMQSTTSQRRAA